MKDSKSTDKTSTGEPGVAPGELTQGDLAQRRFWMGFEHIAVPFGVGLGLLTPLLLILIPNLFEARK